MKPFVRPAKQGPRKVVGANTAESQLAVHPATRERDANNLASVQQNRALKPPTKAK